MMTNTHIVYVGGMITDTRKAGQDHPFPTTGEYNSVWQYYSVAERHEDWLVVAQDPTGLSYGGDESSEAMDRTNWAVIVGVFDDEPSCVNQYTDYSDDEAMDALTAEGVLIVDGKLLVAPDRTEWLDELAKLVDRLEGYPLLDEDEYYRLDYEAWNEYLMDGLKFDTLRDMAGRWDEDTRIIDDETAEAIENAWPDVADQAMNHIHHHDGFSGSHGPDFGECVANAVVDALIAVTRGGRFSRWA